MSDDKLKAFLKKHDVHLERPAGEWDQLQRKIQKPLRPTHLSRFRMVLTAGLVAAGLALVVVLPRWGSYDDRSIERLLDDSASYVDEPGLSGLEETGFLFEAED